MKNEEGEKKSEQEVLRREEMRKRKKRRNRRRRRRKKRTMRKGRVEWEQGFVLLILLPCLRKSEQLTVGNKQMHKS